MNFPVGTEKFEWKIRKRLDKLVYCAGGSGSACDHIPDMRSNVANSTCLNIEYYRYIYHATVRRFSFAL